MASRRSLVLSAVYRARNRFNAVASVSNEPAKHSQSTFKRISATVRAQQWHDVCNKPRSFVNSGRNGNTLRKTYVRHRRSLIQSAPRAWELPRVKDIDPATQRELRAEQTIVELVKSLEMSAGKTWKGKAWPMPTTRRWMTAKKVHRTGRHRHHRNTCVTLATYLF